ncbi:hypothetical protein WISP_47233 [Willisornis vidua]|uniref:Uncharacterized protein n=1 Tax=Willisornis vidua TaxID=1566151 RepID=A0ABQ9DFL5_9PASS|nr:hypothetical protein WISP_47233 [Willisornis vidua]
MKGGVSTMYWISRKKRLTFTPDSSTSSSTNGVRDEEWSLRSYRNSSSLLLLPPHPVPFSSHDLLHGLQSFRNWS